MLLFYLVYLAAFGRLSIIVLFCKKKYKTRFYGSANKNAVQYDATYGMIKFNSEAVKTTAVRECNWRYCHEQQ